MYEIDTKDLLNYPVTLFLALRDHYRNRKDPRWKLKQEMKAEMDRYRKIILDELKLLGFYRTNNDRVRPLLISKCIMAEGKMAFLIPIKMFYVEKIRPKEIDNPAIKGELSTKLHKKVEMSLYPDGLWIYLFPEDTDAIW